MSRDPLMEAADEMRRFADRIEGLRDGHELARAQAQLERDFEKLRMGVIGDVDRMQGQVERMPAKCIEVVFRTLVSDNFLDKVLDAREERKAP